MPTDRHKQTKSKYTADRQIPGLGLGLHIAREIAARHGGYLRAASDGDGCGTTMTLWLPLDDEKREE